MVYRNGNIPKVKVENSFRLSIYGLTFDNILAGGSEKIIALDDLDHLCIFEKTSKPLSRIFTFGFKNDDLLCGATTYSAAAINSSMTAK
jgi:hypothetical protein